MRYRKTRIVSGQPQLPTTTRGARTGATAAAAAEVRGGPSPTAAFGRDPMLALIGSGAVYSRMNMRMSASAVCARQGERIDGIGFIAALARAPL